MALIKKINLTNLNSIILIIVILITASLPVCQANSYGNKSIVRSYYFGEYTFAWTTGEQKLPWVKMKGATYQKIEQSIMLPIKIELLAISPNASVHLETIDANCRKLPSSWLTNAFNLPEYAIPFTKFPQETVTLAQQGFIRFQKYQEIKINPIIYKNNNLYYCNFIKIKINWTDDWTGYEKVDIIEPSFEPVYQTSFINYSPSLRYKAKKINQSKYNDVQLEFLAPTAGYKIKINEDGIYKLTYQKLAEAGLPVDSIQPTTFQLFNKNIEVPIYVFGEQDNKFDPTDYIEFYGIKHVPEAGREEEFEGADYTDDNVYWLYYGRALGKRIQMRNVEPVNGYEMPSNYWYTMLYNPYGYFYSQVWQHGMNHWVWAFELKGPKSQCPPPPPPYNCNCNLCDPSGSKPFSFTLPGIDTSATENAYFTVKLLARSGSSASYPDHHTIIHVNNCFNQDDAYWDGKINYLHQFSTPHSCLQNDNVLTLQIPGDVSNPDECCRERVALDSISVTYKKLFSAIQDSIDFSYPTGNWRFVINNFQNDNIHLYDISDPYNPILLNNFTKYFNGNWQVIFEDSISSEFHYIAVSDAAIKEPSSIIKDNPSFLKNPENKADYLIITDDTFINSSPLNDLKTWKESLGYIVKVINITDIYDEFSFGIFDPIAIKKFLEYVFNNWQQPIPAYVLLIGDPTFDFKNKRGSPDWFLFTPTLIGDDPSSPSGIYSSDTSLAAVVGSDILPDFHIGRLSVNSVEVLQYNVSKIIQYESLVPSSVAWKKYITMVADYGEIFETPHNQAQEAFLPSPPYETTKLYYSTSQPPYPDPSGMRNGLTQSINNGTLIISFAGHGTPNSWGSVAFWNNQDVSNLSNNNKYPLITNVSCYTGAIHRDSPNQTTFEEVLMEAFMNRNSKGAIAAIAPSSSDSTSSVDQSIFGFYQEIFSRNIKDILIGSIFYRTILDKLALPDEAKGLVLLGDPSIKLLLPIIPQPQNLTATGQNLKVILNWDASNPPVAGYNIYRCIYHSVDVCSNPDSNFIKINSSIITSPYYEDTDVSNLTTYYYFVVATNEEGFESIPTNISFATPMNNQPPSPPTGLVATDPKIGSIINLSWNPNPEADIEGYQLYIGTEPLNYSYSVWVGNKTNFSAGGLSAYHIYYFALKAKNTSGFYSNLSQEVSAMPTKLGGSQPKRIIDLILTKSAPYDVLLQWSKPILNEANAPCNVIAYAVYRGLTSTFTPDHSNPGQTNSNRIAAINDASHNYYQDPEALKSNDDYYYLVSAYDEDWMESSVATNPPKHIADLMLIKQSPSIIFQWSPATPNQNSWIVGYNLYKSNLKSFIPDRANHTNLHTFAPSPPIIDDTLLNNENTYYFKILTVDNRSNESIP